MKLLLLTLSAMVLCLCDPFTIKAEASNYRLSMQEKAQRQIDTINTINLEGVKISVTDDSPYKFESRTVSKYNIIASNGIVIGTVDVMYDMDETIYDSIAKCEKTNYISKEKIYTDISHDTEKDVTTFKVDERKSVLYHYNDIGVLFTSLSVDKVVLGNNYLNKTLDYLVVEFQKE